MRRLAVKMALSGKPQKLIAEQMQVHHGTVCRWIARHATGGDSALVSRKAKGPDSKLSDKQIAKLRKIIVGKNPRQMNYRPALWMLSLIGQLIQGEFGIVLHESTIARMMDRLGVTP